MRGWTRETLKSLPARAPPPRAGDRLAGIAEEDVAAELVLADVPLAAMLAEPTIPCVDDKVTPRTFAARPCSRERANSSHPIQRRQSEEVEAVEVFDGLELRGLDLALNHAVSLTAAQRAGFGPCSDFANACM
jgi:hypothetical protein